MMSRSGTATRFNVRLGRREWLFLGGLTTMGLALPDLLRAREAKKRAKAKSCLFIFLQGGPSQLEGWDPKPDAIEEHRGEFKAIATKVPGTIITEHLPRLAGLADRYALIRSCTHDDVEHNSAAHACMTGRMHPKKGQIVPPSADDFPPLGAVLARIRGAPRTMPAWVTMPAYMINSGVPFPSQNAGFLGSVYDPFPVRSDPNAPGFHVAGLSLSRDLGLDRLDARRGLRKQLDDAARTFDRTGGMDQSHSRAFDLILSPTARAAFRLDRETDRMRDRYGRTPFGQSLLLSRRLIEAGVPLVTACYTNEKPRRPGCAISWDTHEDNFPDLKNKLLPDLDRALSALLEDLHQRGLLAETLVIAAGEFGRLPKINQDAGRDHNPRAYTVLWAGGGVRGGLVHGATDRNAEYPIRNPVTPGALAASVYHALGVDLRTELIDRQGRPHVLAVDEPVLELFG